MAQSTIDAIPPGPKLDALTAEKVFGWKGIHRLKGRPGIFYGQRQDNYGLWRPARVPNFSTNPLHAFKIKARMKELGRLHYYMRELCKIAKLMNIPVEWTPSDQRCRAAVKAMGEYGQVIPFIRKQTSRRGDRRGAQPMIASSSGIFTLGAQS